MNIKNETGNVFFNPRTGYIVDVCVQSLPPPAAAIGYWGRKTLSETKKEPGYDDVQEISLDEASRRSDEFYCSPPQEITKESFLDALECLPPVHWRNKGGTESFKMSERLSGSITAIYCRIGDRYFSFHNRITLSHEEICILVTKEMSL